MKLNHQKAWVVAVDMGYGHQRAADPLRKIAYGGKVINANNYKGIPLKDKKTWEGSQKFYEFVSRFKKVPVVGELAFDLFDTFQQIPEFYPNRDLSDTNVQLEYIMHLINTKDWGKHLIKKLAKNDLPLITTFFVVGFMAERFGYAGDIYVVVTDTDLSRTWVPLDPKKSRIRYFAPNQRAVDRLKEYGVDEEKIFFTGFPLPVELIGSKKMNVLRSDVGKRLTNLDPNRKFIGRFADSIKHHLSANNFPKTKKDHILTLMFAVGGAGAQRELGVEIVKSLATKIQRKEISILLVAGTHKDIKEYFLDEITKLGLEKEINKGIKILHSVNKEDYFRAFNKALRKTDILWTKPSELSFYTALGIPIVMSEPIGSQEDFNRHWLLMIGSGVDEEKSKYTNEWLFDLIDTGWFAEAAIQGFLEAPKFGTYNIQKVISYKAEECLKCKTEMEY